MTASDETVRGSEPTAGPDQESEHDVISTADGEDTVPLSFTAHAGPGDDGSRAFRCGRSGISGGPGNDVLRGQTGSDVLRGGPGDDVLVGGGADVSHGDAGHDRCVAERRLRC